MINLRKIDEENFKNAFEMKLKEGQERFVSHPIRSLAQAYVYRKQCQPFGIYLDDLMIGYVMVIYDIDAKEYNIWHMMIDNQYQSRGYGSLALDKVLDYIEIRPFGDAKRISLTCHKDNLQGLNLYKQKGFKNTGIIYGDEVELYLDIYAINNDIEQWKFTKASDIEFQNLFKLYFEELEIRINDWESVFKDIGSGEKTKILLLKEGDISIGFIIFEPMEMKSWFFTKTDGFIREFYITKEYRKRGYGSKLLSIVEAYFVKQGIYTILLTTDTAEPFYIKHGYIYVPNVKAINEQRVMVKNMEFIK